MNPQSKLRAESRLRTPDSAVGSAEVEFTDGEKVFPEPTKGLHIGRGGHIVAVFPDGSKSLLENIPDGDVRPYSVIKIIEEGTTASKIVALF